MKKKVEITKDMTLAEVLNYRKNAPCGVAQMETVEEASMVHEIDLELLLKKLNEVD